MKAAQGGLCRSQVSFSDGTSGSLVGLDGSPGGLQWCEGWLRSGLGGLWQHQEQLQRSPMAPRVAPGGRRWHQQRLWGALIASGVARDHRRHQEQLRGSLLALLGRLWQREERLTQTHGAQRHRALFTGSPVAPRAAPGGLRHHHVRRRPRAGAPRGPAPHAPSRRRAERSRQCRSTG